MAELRKAPYRNDSFSPQKRVELKERIELSFPPYQGGVLPVNYSSVGVPGENRTPVSGLRGRQTVPLFYRDKLAYPGNYDIPTIRLTNERSASELRIQNGGREEDLNPHISS